MSPIKRLVFLLQDKISQGIKSATLIYHNQRKLLTTIAQNSDTYHDAVAT